MSSYRRWSRRLQRRSPTPGPPSLRLLENLKIEIKVEVEDLNLSVVDEDDEGQDVDHVDVEALDSSAPHDAAAAAPTEVEVNAEVSSPRSKAGRFARGGFRRTPTTRRSRGQGRRRRRNRRQEFVPNPLANLDQDQQDYPNPLVNKDQQDLYPNPLATGGGDDVENGDIGSIQLQLPECQVFSLNIKSEPGDQDCCDQDALVAATEFVSEEEQHVDVGEECQDEQGTAEAVSPSNYPPIESPDLETLLKKYPEMVMILRPGRSLEEESLEKGRSSGVATALLEQPQPQPQAQSVGEEVDGVKNFDICKLQWELESLMAAVRKRKEIMRGFMEGRPAITSTTATATAPSETKIRQEKISDDVTTTTPALTTAAVAVAVTVTDGSGLGRGCRQKKISLRKSEQLTSVKPRASSTPKTNKDKKVNVTGEVVEDEVEELEPGSEEEKKAEIEEEFHKFVDSFISEVTSAEVEYINQLWHLGEYEYLKHETFCPVVSPLHSATVGYYPNGDEGQDEESSEEDDDESQSEEKTVEEKPGTGNPNPQEQNCKVAYTSLRRDEGYTRRLEFEIEVIETFQQSLRMVLVNPDNEDAAGGRPRPLVPPLQVSPLLEMEPKPIEPNPKPKPPVKLPSTPSPAPSQPGKENRVSTATRISASKIALRKAAALGAWMKSALSQERKEFRKRIEIKEKLERELECFQIVNSANLLGLKTKAEPAREYFAVKNRLKSLDNCIVEVHSGIEKLKKRIKEFGDENGEEAENLKKLREAGKTWLQSRHELCTEMDILEKQLFPQIPDE